MSPCPIRSGRGGRVGPRLALAWLLAALMLMPLLGRWHQVVHAGGAGPALAVGQGTVDVHAHGLTGTHAGPHASAGWPGGHTAADCLLFDQLALAHAIGQPVDLALPVALAPPDAPPVMAGIASRHQARAVARGPPAPHAVPRHRA